MKFTYCFALFSVALSLAGCGEKNHEMVGKGVSDVLNAHRKKSVESIHYDIVLEIPKEKTERIKGNEQVSFVLKNVDTPVVLDFNSAPEDITSVTSGGKKISFQVKDEHILIAPEELKSGENVLEISFLAGDLSLNRSDEYLYTLFVPDRASTCFPLFDQPNLKATYQLTLKTPADWEAISNGALEKKEVAGESATYHFGKTKPISSYLFAFAAGKFFKTDEVVDGRAMTMYYRETDSVKVKRNRSEIFRLHGESLKWLEDYTAIPYPFGKFDFVLVPSFQYGGMEHPGSVFYNESALFLDENATVNRRLARASVIAHESAHMWFGDLVTMDWFNDVWLKEVFANFMAAKIVNPSFPEINHELRFLLAHYPAAYEVDRTRGTNPILQKLDNLKNAGTLYGSIIYQKAPIVMRMLERRIGEGAMRSSLREYLKTFSFSNATWDDLIAIIDKQAKQDMAGWSKVWVKTPNMPEYEFGAQGLQQKRDSVSGRIWQQPVRISGGDGSHITDTTFQSMDADSRFTNLQSPMFPNADGASYGYFPMDTASLSYFKNHYADTKDVRFRNPLFRGAMLVNQWEGFLRGAGTAPDLLADQWFGFVQKEKDPLLTDYLLGNFSTIWWLFLTDAQRKERQDSIESGLWTLMESTTDKGMKMSYFKSYRGLVWTKAGTEKLRKLWDGSLVVKELVISEDEKIATAYELAIRVNDAPAILEKQLTDTKNPDRQAKMKFVIPALHAEEARRDAFFETLKKEQNREKEAWVLEALHYLHHPVRQKSAEKYLRPSLDLLREIQLTGDIFFPTRWTNTTFSGHSSREAAAVAPAFLQEHKAYPPFLTNKIWQATDMLERAARVKSESN